MSAFSFTFLAHSVCSRHSECVVVRYGVCADTVTGHWSVIQWQVSQWSVSESAVTDQRWNREGTFSMIYLFLFWVLCSPARQWLIMYCKRVYVCLSVCPCVCMCVCLYVYDHFLWTEYLQTLWTTFSESAVWPKDQSIWFWRRFGSVSGSRFLNSDEDPIWKYLYCPSRLISRSVEEFSDLVF